MRSDGVYRCLVTQLVPRLRKFNNDLRILNDVLTELIARAKRSQNKTDLEDLQERNYDKARGEKFMLVHFRFHLCQDFCRFFCLLSGVLRSFCFVPRARLDGVRPLGATDPS